ncbi:extracellular dioxygenase [Colletotrichum incanum]|uniref:Extracellular dioxygenase n=1 Tax=Colletotrichum incanum TaxID=1573173 RepID=A0A161WGH2_COLIC|nr:extracellular dioxygenase [Colletotrichum incanum]
MYMDIQIIDTETCKPVPDIWVEIWHTNSTGVCSGIVSSTNGVGGVDPSNVFNTFRRGLQKTNAQGVVWFGSKLNGHYSGRSPHIHIMTHVAGTAALANGTIENNIATHAFVENKQDPYFH